MTTSTAALPTGRVVRKLVLTAVGVLLFAGGLTFLYLGMRAVMDVGGFCASGGPYQIRQECPDGTGFIVLGIFAGLIGTGLTAAGTFAGGPQLWTLAWPRCSARSAGTSSSTGSTHRRRSPGSYGVGSSVRSPSSRWEASRCASCW